MHFDYNTAVLWLGRRRPRHLVLASGLLVVLVLLLLLSVVGNADYEEEQFLGSMPSSRFLMAKRRGELVHKR